MKRLVACVVLAACGPSVGAGVDDAAGDGATSATDSADTGTSGHSSADASASSVTVGTASGDSTSSSSSDDVDGSGGSFIETGCFTHCTPPECDPFVQDCAEGEKCVPWSSDGSDAWTALRCAPVDPAPASVGEPCLAQSSGLSGLDNCEAAALCWGVDPVTLEGVCVALCAGTPEAPICADDRVCVSMFDDAVNVCVPSCDPLASTCAEHEACTHTGDDLEFACLPVPPFIRGEYGAPCDGGLASCGDGFVCADPELVPGCVDDGFGCCTVLGDYDDPPVCPDASQTCLPFERVDPTMCICGVPP